MTCGKDDLTKATQMGTTTGEGNWTGVFHQYELGFSDGLRCSGKSDVVNKKNYHEMYGHFLHSQTVEYENGTSINGYTAHYECMKNKYCDSTSYP